MRLLGKKLCIHLDFISVGGDGGLRVDRRQLRLMNIRHGQHLTIKIVRKVLLLLSRVSLQILEPLLIQIELLLELRFRFVALHSKL